MRIVIKVGTSTLTHPTGCVNIRRMESLCRAISDIMNSGVEVVLVSSGAVGMGVGKLHLKERPRALDLKQAAAAVGQCELMYVYDRMFSGYNRTVAQLLLTAPDLHEPSRSEKVSATLDCLLALSVLPIVNENDTVSTAEIEFGDNDTLAAEVASHCRADLLVILSDIEGLYTADPRRDPAAKLIDRVYTVDEDLMKLAEGGKTALSTGGMVTKLRAAKIAMASGCDMVIAAGQNPEILYDILDGKAVGTRFYAKKGETV